MVTEWQSVYNNAFEEEGAMATGSADPISGPGLRMFRKMEGGCMLNIKFRVIILCAGIVLTVGCATSSGPLATLPMTSPVASNYNLEGIKHFNGGQWEKAKIDFERAVQADAKSAAAHFNLALSFHKMGQHDEAKREFTIAGELAPKSKPIVNTTEYRNHLGLSSTFERHISGGYRY